MNLWETCTDHLPLAGATVQRLFGSEWDPETTPQSCFCVRIFAEGVFVFPHEDLKWDGEYFAGLEFFIITADGEVETLLCVRGNPGWTLRARLAIRQYQHRNPDKWERRQK